MNTRRQPEPTGRGLDPIARLDERPPWQRAVVLVLVLAALLCVLMPEIVFQNKIFLVPDATAWESFASIGREVLEGGSYPLWNPYLFCGMPSYPSQMYTPYVYPLSYLTHILHAYLGAPEMVWLLAHYLLAGAGIYLLCRSLDVRPSVSMLAGAVFMLMPNYLAAGVNGHGSQACSIAFMPYAIYFARNVYRGYRRVPMAAALAITLGFQMLRGHIQIAYYTYLVIGLLFIFEAVRSLRAADRRSVLVNLVFTAAVFVAALGIAAVLIVPVRQYVPLSTRGGGAGGGLEYGYATGWSLNPREMMTFVFPWAFGFGKATYWGDMPFTDYPNYLGAVTAVFSAVAIALCRERWKLFFAVAALMATVVSFGGFLPILYRPMFELLPYFNKFRVPVMVLIVQQLALVVLMAMGIEAFVQRMRAGTLTRVFKPGAVKWFVIGGIILCVLVLVAGGEITDAVGRRLSASGRLGGEAVRLASRSYLADLVKTILLFTAIAALIYAAALRRISAGALIAVLAVVSLVDLFVVARPILHPEAAWRSESYRIIHPADELTRYHRPDAMIEFLQKDASLFRVFPAPSAPLGRWTHSSPPFSDNRFMVSRIFSLGGYHAAKLKSYQDIMDVLFASFNRGVVPLSILNMLNTKYLLAGSPLLRESDLFPIVWQQGDAVVYENTRALPRVFFVDRYRVMRADLMPEALLARDFDPAREVLLERAPPAEPQSAEGSGAEIIEYRPNAVTVRARVERPCILVVSEVAYPDWRVTVDGEEGTILTANYCLRAVSLPAGEHDVRFAIRSDVLTASLAASIVCFLMAAAVLAVYAILGARRAA